MDIQKRTLPPLGSLPLGGVGLGMAEGGRGIRERDGECQLSLRHPVTCGTEFKGDESMDSFPFQNARAALPSEAALVPASTLLRGTELTQKKIHSRAGPSVGAMKGKSFGGSRAPLWGGWLCKQTASLSSIPGQGEASVSRIPASFLTSSLVLWSL